MTKIVLDTFGADRGVSVVVEGAVDALEKYPEVTLVLVGDSDIINAELSKYKYDTERIIVEDAKETITNEESPTVAIRAKKNSSLVRALEITKADPEVVGMVSAGSTGAVLSGGIFKVGRIKGVLRPALCPVLPTLPGGRVCLVDCGANMDCKPEYLAQFALMGVEYMKSLGIENPRVGLVSVGVEDKKGNDLTHAVFKMLKKMPINFVGNMESREALSGDYDVLVTDGFVGNVLLKSIEGTAKMMSTLLKREIKVSTRAKIGYALFMKGAMNNFKASMDYHAFGGAVFVGVEKIIVKSHGSSKASSITASVGQVVQMNSLNFITNIKQAIASVDVKALLDESEEKND
ncbi:MAG: phosphate acyltransferase PlsX [Clostridia bacterium]|nr:phosphate acyltransferase PlsX [Clostridia bacterium]